jgi:hypothetical protein
VPEVLWSDTFGDPTPGAKAFIEFVKDPRGQKIADDNGTPARIQRSIGRSRIIDFNRDRRDFFWHIIDS